MGPRPVPKIETVWPVTAALASVFSEVTPVTATLNMAAGPDPFWLPVKIPKFDFTTRILTGALVTPLNVTVMVASPSGVLDGRMPET